MSTFADMLSYLRKRNGLSQQELADKTGLTRSAIGMYETGKREPDFETLESIADFFNVNIDTLLGKSGTSPPAAVLPANLLPLPSNVIPLSKMKKVPLVGQIACGTPILAEQNITDYIDLPSHIRADYALTCKGDSMINLGIQDGDIVYIRQQENVENGQVAAVMVGDEEATLKRFYYEDNVVQLIAENTTIPPKVFIGEAINRIHVVGLAVAYTHVIE